MFSENNKYYVRCIEIDKKLLIDMVDKKTNETYERVFPICWLTPEVREQIAKDVLAYINEGLPVQWKEVISPHIRGYWDSYGWDVVNYENIDRRVKQKI